MKGILYLKLILTDDFRGRGRREGRSLTILKREGVKKSGKFLIMI